MLNTHWIWFLVLLGPKLFFFNFSPTLSKSFLFFSFHFLPLWVGVLHSLPSTAPPVRPHIKVIYHQDQTHGVRAGDKLIYWRVSSVSVSFMIGVEGHGHRDTFLTRSLWLLVFGACHLAQLDPWIARPHVKATLDSNCWFSLDVAASF